MKKNFFFGLFALATMMVTSSCSEQELVDPSLLNGDAVTFTVNLQQSASTRAAVLAGRGANADKLYYGVYEKTANGGWALIPAISALTGDYTNDKAPATIQYGTPTQVEIKLAKQKKYSVIFWAAHESNNMCNVNWETREMKMTGGSANNEYNDAFWAYNEVEVNAAVAKTVDLYRPFAQLNIGASDQDILDAAAAEMVVEKSQIVLNKVANTFNMETGEATGNTTLTYSSAAILNAENWKFPVNGYKYLALGYVLVDSEDKALVDVELAYTDTKGGAYTSSFTSVPVQRNYRTNIYGNLLSNSADYNVNVQPDLGDGDNVVVTEVATTQQLLAAINDPDIDHVVMTGDIDLAELNTRAASVADPIYISRDITIDGKGFKVKTNGTRAFRINKSDVNVIFNNVNVESRTVMQYPADVRGFSIDPNLTDVVLTLNNCSVDFTDATACDWSYAVNIAGYTDRTHHTIVINGGTYEGANVINANGSENIITIKDATLNSLYPDNDTYFGACIYLNQNGNSTLNVTGTTFNGGHAVAINTRNGNNVTESDNTDNTIVEYPLNGGENVYNIYSAQALASFSDQALNGKTLNICADIDFKGEEFKAIAAARSGSLTIKGYGNTIKNAKVVSGANDNTTGQASFFYPYTGSVLTINDLMFDNIEVDASIDGSGYAGVVVGYAEGKVILNNVGVNNADVYGEKSCGALVGFATATSQLTMNDCDVTNSKVEAKEDRTGAFVGRSAGITTIANCSVDDNFTSIAPDGFANKYIGQRYTSCTSLTIDGKEYVDSYYGLNKAISEAIDGTILLVADGTHEIGMLDASQKSITIEGMSADNVTVFGSIKIVSQPAEKTFTLKNVTFETTNGQSAAIELKETKGLVNFYDCTFKATTDGNKPNGNTIGYISMTNAVDHINVEGCTFDNCASRLGIWGHLKGNANVTSKINNNKFNGGTYGGGGCTLEGQSVIENIEICNNNITGYFRIYTNTLKNARIEGNNKRPEFSKDITKENVTVN